MKITHASKNLTAVDIYHLTKSPNTQKMSDCVGQRMKSKNKLNSIYGMMAQNPVKQDIVYNNGVWSTANDPEAEILAESNRKAFLCYQRARYRLQEEIKLAGENFVYCDTDSVKNVGNIDWTEYNKQREKDSKASGAFAIDPKKE